MRIKLYLILLTLITYIPAFSMEKQPTKPSMPEELACPIEDIWLNIIAQCPAKWKLRETCKYFRDVASISNDQLFLQNPLMVRQDLLNNYILYYASLNHDTVVINLLNQGLSPNLVEVDVHGLSLVDFAIKHKNLNLINILSKHTKLNATIFYHAFIYALLLGYFEIAQSMLTPETANILIPEHLRHEFNPNGSNDKLLQTIAENETFYMRYTHSQWNKYSVADDCNSSPYYYFEFLSRLKQLLEHNGTINNPNYTNKPLKETLLSDFMGLGKINAVRFLINHGASLATNSNKDPLLIKAIGNSHGEKCKQLVELLLNKGVDVNVKRVKYNQTDTALHYAVKFCRYEAVPLLLAHPNIDVNPINNWDETPLDIAIKKHDQEKSIEVNGREGMSHRYATIIQQLIEHGAERRCELDNNLDLTFFDVNWS